MMKVLLIIVISMLVTSNMAAAVTCTKFTSALEYAGQNQDVACAECGSDSDTCTITDSEGTTFSGKCKDATKCTLPKSCKDFKGTFDCPSGEVFSSKATCPGTCTTTECCGECKSFTTFTETTVTDDEKTASCKTIGCGYDKTEDKCTESCEGKSSTIKCPSGEVFSNRATCPDTCTETECCGECKSFTTFTETTDTVELRTASCKKIGCSYDSKGEKCADACTDTNCQECATNKDKCTQCGNGYKKDADTCVASSAALTTFILGLFLVLFY